MAPLPDRKALESMKRTELQRLCKDYGVKANLKSEALIDLLVETQKPVSRSAHSHRSISTRRSSRVGPSRLSSLVIHDSSEEGGLEVKQKETNPGEPNHTPRATRSRKVNEQTRLGVGRPRAAGGAGPRAVTKSISVSKNKRGKNSQAIQLTEATIPEESEEELGLKQGGSPAGTPTREIPPQEVTAPTSSLLSLAIVDKHVADAIRPLHEQVTSFKSGLELINTLRTDVGVLAAQANEIGDLRQKVETLTALVQDLRTQAASSAALETEIKQLRETLSSNQATEVNIKESSGVLTAAIMGTVPTLLGKRHRDSATSNASDEDKEDQRELNSTRKRAKLSHGIDGIGSKPPSPQRENHEEQMENDSSMPQSFDHDVSRTSDQALEEYTKPPPTDHLPDFFPPPSPPFDSGSNLSRFPTSTINASENQQPFTFSYLPMSSMPSSHLFMPSFPYPEPPQSPSPAGIQQVASPNLHEAERSDTFQPFGLPLLGRASRLGSRKLGSSSGGGFVDPHALAHIGPETNSATKNAAIVKAGETGPSTKGLGTEVPPMKRTMYGTELEGDTRFGDFGVEGIGNNNPGFWAGGRL